MHHQEFSWFHGGFGGLIVLALVVGVIFLVITFLRRNTTDNDRELRDGLTSQELLQRRLDSGEITAAEYESMQKAISVQPDCLELLNRRYAQGLITAAEYERSRKEIFTLIDSYF